MDHTQEIGGAPADIFKTDEEVQADREAKQEQMAQQQMLEQMQQGGDGCTITGSRYSGHFRSCCITLIHIGKQLKTLSDLFPDGTETTLMLKAADGSI